MENGTINGEAKLSFLKAFNKVQSSLESAKKDANNPHFKSKYATLASVNEAVMDKIGAAGFCLLSGCVEIGDRPHLRTNLYHVDGHAESFDYPLIKTENPQHLASAITYARRYSICALFNLSVEDDDGNAAASGHKNGSNGHSEAKKEEAPRKSEHVGEDGEGFDTLTADFIPAKFKETKTKAGKPMYWMETETGTAFSSFKKEQGEVMKRAVDNGEIIRVTYTESGKYKNVFSIQDHEGKVV